MAIEFKKSPCGTKLSVVTTSEKTEEYDLTVLEKRKVMFQKDILHYNDKLAEVEEMIREAKALGIGAEV